MLQKHYWNSLGKNSFRRMAYSLPETWAAACLYLWLHSDSRHRQTATLCAMSGPLVHDPKSTLQGKQRQCGPHLCLEHSSTDLFEDMQLALETSQAIFSLPNPPSINKLHGYFRDNRCRIEQLGWTHLLQQCHGKQSTINKNNSFRKWYMYISCLKGACYPVECIM